jgi:hypothetical protein
MAYDVDLIDSSRATFPDLLRIYESQPSAIRAIAVHGYYLGEEEPKLLAARLTDFLSLVWSGTHDNRFFYHDACGSYHRLDIARCTDLGAQATMPFVPHSGPDDRTGEARTRYRPLNPYVLPDGQGRGSGYTVLLRCVNYEKLPGHGYRSLQTRLAEGRRRIVTINILLSLDDSMNVIDQSAILDRSGVPWWRVYVQGFEDLQLFRHDGRLHFVSTVISPHEPPGMWCGVIEPAYHSCQSAARSQDEPISAYVIRRALPFDKHIPSNCEKNHLPFVDVDGTCCTVYSHGPLVLQRFDCNSLLECPGRAGETAPTSIAVRRVSAAHPENGLARYLGQCRGSGGPVRFEFGGRQGWLLVPHEVLHIYGNPLDRMYVHRFAFYDDDWCCRAVSRAFHVFDRGIEFVRSACWKNGTDRSTLLLGMGTHDRNALIVEVCKTTVDGLLCDYQST